MIKDLIGILSDERRCSQYLLRGWGLQKVPQPNFERLRFDDKGHYPTELTRRCWG